MAERTAENGRGLCTCLTPLRPSGCESKPLPPWKCLACGGYACEYADPGQKKCPSWICDCFIDMYPDSPRDLHPEAFIAGTIPPSPTALTEAVTFVVTADTAERYEEAQRNVEVLVAEWVAEAYSRGVNDAFDTDGALLRARENGAAEVRERVEALVDEIERQSHICNVSNTATIAARLRTALAEPEDRR